MPIRLVVAHAEFKRDELKKFNFDEPLFEADKIEFLIYMIDKHGKCVLSVTGHPALFTLSLRSALDEAGARYGKEVRQRLRDCFDGSMEQDEQDRIKDILDALKHMNPDNYMHRGPNYANR